MKQSINTHAVFLIAFTALGAILGYIEHKWQINLSSDWTADLWVIKVLDK